MDSMGASFKDSTLHPTLVSAVQKFILPCLSIDLFTRLSNVVVTQGYQKERRSKGYSNLNRRNQHKNVSHKTHASKHSNTIQC